MRDAREFGVQVPEGISVDFGAVMKRLRRKRAKISYHDSAILDGEDDGFVRIHANNKGRILGATLVAAHAGDMIGEISLAMTNGLGLGAIASTIHPYPTQTETIRKVGDLYNRTRLTPVVKWIMKKLLAWRR